MSEEKIPLPKTADEIDVQLEGRFWDEMHESRCIPAARAVLGTQGDAKQIDEAVVVEMRRPKERIHERFVEATS